MRRRSTVESIFALRQLQEKCREGQSNVHAILIGLEKAYDRVPREKLYWCMRGKLVLEKYVHVVRDMFTQSETVVRWAAETTDAFPVKVGLHPASALSPFLFVIIMDCLIQVRECIPWQVMFADDTVLCANSSEKLEADLKKWRTALETRGLKISRKETEYLYLQGEEAKKIQLLDDLVSKVEDRNIRPRSEGKDGVRMEKWEENDKGAMCQESSHLGKGQSLQQSGAASDVVCDGFGTLIS